MIIIFYIFSNIFWVWQGEVGSLLMVFVGALLYGQADLSFHPVG